MMLSCNGFRGAIVAVVLGVLAMCPCALGQSDASRSGEQFGTSRSGPALVKEGNRLLDSGDFAAALEMYEQAGESLPDKPEIAYNRGIALYRLGEYSQAESAFQDAVTSGLPELEASAKYNLGRCSHAAALGDKEDLQVAISDLSKAVRYYDDALQIVSDEPDALKNKVLAERFRAFLEKKLEEQKQKQPTSQPTSQPSSQPTSQPDKQPTSQPTSQPQEGEDGQEEQKGDQDQQQKGDQGEQDQQQKDNQGQDQQQQDGPKGDEQKKGEQTKEGERKELTPEEVEGMLQQARDAERQRREDKRKRAIRTSGRAKVEKDW